MTTDPSPVPWYQAPKITVPLAAARQIGFGIEIALDDQLKSDFAIAGHWAAQASASCACPTYGDGGTSPVPIGGYDWLTGNAAAYRDWLQHSAGEDPVVFFCKHGYDSPLATHQVSYDFNRTVAEASLTVAAVQFNGKDYPARIVPYDCFAGCSVYADVPCMHELQATIVKLRSPDQSHPQKCIWFRAGAGAGMTCGN